jgi:hypothetical protein
MGWEGGSLHTHFMYFHLSVCNWPACPGVWLPPTKVARRNSGRDWQRVEKVSGNPSSTRWAKRALRGRTKVVRGGLQMWSSLRRLRRPPRGAFGCCVGVGNVRRRARLGRSVRGSFPFRSGLAVLSNRCVEKRDRMWYRRESFSVAPLLSTMYQQQTSYPTCRVPMSKNISLWTRVTGRTTRRKPTGPFGSGTEKGPLGRGSSGEGCVGAGIGRGGIRAEENSKRGLGTP